MPKTPEPIVLVVALILLAIGCAALAYVFPSVEDITGVKTLDPTGVQAKPLKATDVDASLALWNSPAMWTEPDNHNRMFQSDEFLFYPSAYPNGNYIVKIGENSRSPSGVLLTWYRKYHLDFTDPKVDREDPDGDGFSNIVEYKNDPLGVRQKAADCDPAKACDPLDPKSHPDYLARLRLQKFEPRPFHIQFKGYEQLNGEYYFQLYLNDVPSFNQPPLLKNNDKLGFEGYVIGAFHLIFKDETDPATKVTVKTDESTLDLVKPDIGLTVTVPFRTEINSPEYTADFVMLMPSEVGKVIKVSRGKIFTAPYLPDQQFLVIEADDKGAKIRDVKTNQEYFILKLIDSEWDEVPEVPAQPTQ